MDKTEQDLIKRLKQGDEKAFRYLFDTQYPLLCRIAADFLKDSFLAETIVGDVIYHLWENRNVVDIQVAVRAYLVRAVRNRCINYLQQSYVVKETPFPETDDFLYTETLLPLSNSDSYPLALLLEKELEYEIQRAIQNLPDDCRIVFEMSRFDNLKYAEIALQLNISVNTVKYHMKNALSKLSYDLGKYLMLLLAILGLQ